MLNTYKLYLACVLVLQYLHLRERKQAETKAEKWAASPESSQIDTIWIQRKKCRFTNLNLRMQEKFREGLLKILKGYEDLQKPALKAGRDNLNDFRSNSELLENLFKSFKDASEREIKLRNSSGDLDENQLETEWAQLRPKRAQQRLSQHIIYNYAQKENPYSEPSSFFKFIVHLLQNFDPWIKKMWEKAEAGTYLKGYQFNVENLLQYQKALYLLRNYALLTKIMKRYYNNLYTEHFRYEKTLKIIWSKIFWSVIHNDIQQYVKKCEIC